MRLLHIAAGILGVASGAVALASLKGARLHRRSGTIFVYAMLVVSATGAALAALRPTMAVMIAGIVTSYLVLTALLTVRRPGPDFRWIDSVVMLVALALGLASIRFGFEAWNDVSGTKDGHPPATYFLLGAVSLMAALGDARMMLAGRLHGGRRIARHLWRMCVALGAGAVVAESPTQRLLAIPTLLVMSVMLYWLARVGRNDQLFVGNSKAIMSVVHSHETSGCLRSSPMSLPRSVIGGEAGGAAAVSDALGFRRAS